MRIILTGGAGFIGVNLLKYWISNTNHEILIVDNFGYASNRNLVDKLSKKFPKRIKVCAADISDERLLEEIFSDFLPNSLIHLAAESHVDNSIKSSFPFIKSNILGTYSLLEATRKYLSKRSSRHTDNFLFHHVSTDEVFGDLDTLEISANENCRYLPSSPYSASKACSDHLVTSWGRTFGIHYVISHCSNNYGPFQHSEKLIPKTILNALSGKPIPLYGDGKQIRDWLFVNDHAEALHLIFFSGLKNQTFNIGGNSEVTNIDLVTLICEILQDLKPSKLPYKELITKVDDRLGHDRRYSIDCSKLHTQLGWRPKMNLREGLELTMREYLNGAQ